MGNAIVAASSIFIPLFNRLVTVPYFYDPIRWNRIPWHQPFTFEVSFMIYLANVIILMILATISGMMSTQRECQKYDVKHSIKRSIWVILGYFVGCMFAFFLPIVKAPLLMLLSWMPYASYIVNGLITAPFVLIFGAMGNSTMRNDLCGRK